MSEISETYSALRNYRSIKRYQNKTSSTEILIKHEIPFVSKNNGVHLIVSNRYDYWPSTGLYINRKTGKRKRGVFNLIKEIKQSSFLCKAI